jgi:hypothetical protein
MSSTVLDMPFPVVAFEPFDGKKVTVTYVEHLADPNSVKTVTGTLVAANGAGVIVKLSSGKHAWVSLEVIVGMVEQ